MAKLGRRDIQAIVHSVVKAYSDKKAVNHIEGKNLPSRKVIYEVLDDLFEILFPGYMGDSEITWAEIPYFVGDKVNAVYLKLSEQITRALRYRCKLEVCRPVPRDKCKIEAERAARKLLEMLPEIRGFLKEDVEAAFDGDPAAQSRDEIILCYPYIEAIATHRIAHVLYQGGVPLVPRMMAERAHSRTGVDIHPGAQIGRRFFIDHATGVVIGETTVIGNNVKVYQGVTLGALSFPKDERGKIIRGGKRHPTLEDGVTVYSNATILGGNTIIGKNSVIGGNVWLTKSVPPSSHVTMSKSELILREREHR